MTRRLGVRDEDVTVVVRNSASRTPTPPPDAPAGAGHGLAGMRERVQRAGGDCRAGPTPDHGWQVEARLPRPSGST